MPSGCRVKQIQNISRRGEAEEERCMHAPLVAARSAEAPQLFLRREGGDDGFEARIAAQWVPLEIQL